MKARRSTRIKRKTNKKPKPILIFKIGVQHLPPSEYEHYITRKSNSLKELRSEYHLIFIPVDGTTKTEIYKL